MTWLAWTGAGIAAAALAVAGLAACGASRWNEATRGLLDRLEAAREPAASFDPNGLEGLPAPVRRYLREVLADGQPVVAAARMEHAGTFNLSEDGERWIPFTSAQRVLTRRPGFVWDARMPVLPGLAVRVHDACIAGEGILRPAVLGLFALMDLRDTGDVARGELMRFLAEAAWYPTALLPGQGVRWQALDGRTARASLADGPLSVELDFAFGDDGLIEAVRAASRGRAAGGRVAAAPWEGRWSDYRRHEGMLVPETGEVAWLLPGGRHPYWRGKVTALACEFAN